MKWHYEADFQKGKNTHKKKMVWKKPAVGSSALNKQAAKYVKSANPFAHLKYYSLDGSSQSTGFVVYPP